MNLCAGGQQRVDRPVPAVGRLDDDPRTRTSLRDLRGEDLPVIGEPHRLQTLTLLGHPHHHRAIAVQIKTNNLPSVVAFAHRGLLRHWDMSTPSIRRGPTRSGGPAPSSHQDWRAVGRR
jgi:hypothetical protein